MHGDFDWSQIAFLIMVVVVGFIRWLGSAIQKNKEQVPPLTEHEKALREEAWRRQTGQGGAPPLPQGEGKEFDPWGELRDLFKPETGRSAPPLPPPATTRAPELPRAAARALQDYLAGLSSDELGDEAVIFLVVCLTSLARFLN